MNFTKFDMVLLIVMSIGIVVMSFVFPALGLTSIDTGESDIPEFEMDADRFDFVGEFPSEPDTGGSGSLTVNNSVNNTQNSTSFGDVQLILYTEADSDGGTISDPTTTVALVDFSGSEPYDAHWHEFGENVTVGDSTQLQEAGFTVNVTVTSVENLGESNYTWSVDWVMEESEDNWFVVDVADGLFHMIEIWMWGVGTMFETTINIIGMLYDVTTFMFATAGWLATTYGGIIQAADSWVAVFVAIPGLLLSLEFAKLGMIGISLLPFT